MTLEHSIANLYRRLQHLVRPAQQTASSVETGTVSQVQAQINALELRDGLNSPQLFGFASASPTGTDLVILNLAGDNANPVVIASNHQSYRPTGMQSGECQLYDTAGQSVYVSQAEGGTIILKANARIVLQVGSAIVTLTEANLTSTVDGIFETISVVGHQHPQGDDSHGDTEQDTGPPIPST